MLFDCILALARTGRNNDIKMAIIAITTNSSINVNAADRGSPERLKMLPGSAFSERVGPVGEVDALVIAAPGCNSNRLLPLVEELGRALNIEISMRREGQPSQCQDAVRGGNCAGSRQTPGIRQHRTHLHFPYPTSEPTTSQTI